MEGYAGAFNEINAGRYNRLLQRLISIKGGPPAATLAGDVLSCLVLEQDAQEWPYLQGIRVLASSGLQVANVGAVSRFRFRNPANSGVLALIDQIWYCVGTLISGVELRNYGTSSSNLTNIATSRARDMRANDPTPNNAGACTLSFEAAAASGVVIYQSGALANVPYLLEPRMVLPPGSAIELAGNTANVQLMMSIWWRERQAEEGELTQ